MLLSLAVPLVLSTVQSVSPPVPDLAASIARHRAIGPFLDLPVVSELPAAQGAWCHLADFDADGRPEGVSVIELVTGTRFEVVKIDPYGQGREQGWSWALQDNASTTYNTLPPLVGDVTGDGLADIVVDRFHANQSSAGASGFLVRDGLAGPAPNLFGVTAGGNVAAWTLGTRAPFVGQDLLVVHAGDDQAPAAPHLRWWHFVGNAFTGGPSTPLSSADLARSPVAIDFDGDGRDDLLTLRGDPVTGVGAYTTLGDALVPSGVFALPANWTATDEQLTIGDFDGDGDIDAALIGRCVLGLELWPLVQTAPGVFVPGAVQLLPLPLGQTLGSARWIDVDGDGTSELVFGEGRLGIVESQNGVMARVTYRRFPASDRILGSVDLDLDGHRDLITSKSVLFGTGRLDGGRVSMDSESVELSGRLVVDWEDDGDLDVLSATGSVAVNDGTGLFENGAGGWPAAGPGNLFGRAASVGDFDGDGRVDYLAQFLLLQSFPMPPIVLTMALLTDDGLGGYVATTNATALGVEIPDDAMQPWPTADVDGDGDLDVVTDGGWWRNDGTGWFGAAVVASWSGDLLATADFDGDGDDEVVVRQNGFATVLRHSAGGFTQTTFGTFLDTDRAFVANVLGTSAPELVVLNPTTEQLSIFQWTGSSLALALSTTVPGLRADPPFAGDVDGDGTPELFLQRLATDLTLRLTVVRPRSAGGFRPEREFVLPGIVDGFHDVDSDGDADLWSGGFAFTNRTFDGALRGVVQQYGAGLPGGGGAVPVLGAGGPLRVGSAEPATIRLRRAPAASVGILFLGTGAGSLPYPGVAGLTLYVDPLLASLSIATDGPAGVPGAGSMTFAIQSDPSLAGVTRFQQTLIFDPLSPTGLAASNGLRTTMGLE
ncbi:MAG: VCBS repeat-containing protein [Planctomycetota bacterium]